MDTQLSSLLDESAENLAFEIVMQSCFATWPPLVLAVEGSFGGRHSAQKAMVLFEDYLRFFCDRCEKTPQDELIDFLDQRLDDLFFLECDTSDLAKLAAITLQLYERAVARDFVHINLVLQANSKRVADDIIWGGKKPTVYPPASRVARPKAPQLEIHNDEAGLADDEEEEEDDEEEEGGEEGADEASHEQKDGSAPGAEEEPSEKREEKREIKKESETQEGWTTVSSSKRGRKGH